MKCWQAPTDEISISVSAQELSYRGQAYCISSSKFGVGSKEGSNKTPIGAFQVSEKFGGGEHPHTIYKGRRPLGVWNALPCQEGTDMILSRILRLTGLEGENHNTYQRYIYIHGTNDEEHVGELYSIGCIRMKNLEIINLYNQVPVGTVVRISK